MIYTQFICMSIVVGILPFSLVRSTPSRTEFGRGGARGEIPYRPFPSIPVPKTIAKPIKMYQNEPEYSCGVPSRGQTRWSKVVGGNDAAYGSVPWQVNLEQYGRGGNETWEHICGGVLISKHHVLTAAHCLLNIYSENIDNFRLIIGNHRLERFDEGERVFTLRAESIVIHSQYGQCRSEHSNDLALIRIKDQWGSGVKFSDWIRPVCLPEVEDSEPPPGTLCQISGWGRSKNYGPKETTNILQVAQIPLQKRKVCQRIYNPPEEWSNNRRQRRRTKSGKPCYPEHFSDEMLCAGFPQNSQKIIGTCTGDSGSPLTTLGKDGRFILTGIVSWFKGGLCGASGPTVFTKVSHYLKWISEFKILLGP